MFEFKFYRLPILIVLLAFAFFGFFLPVFEIGLDVMGFSTSLSVSVSNVLQLSNNVNNLGFGGLPIEIDLFSNIGRTLAVPIIAYASTALLIILIIALSFFKKLQAAVLFTLILTIALFGYAGWSFLQFPSVLTDSLTESMGILGAFINLEDMVFLNLSFGYWFTIIMLILSLIFQIASGIILRLSENQVQIQ